MALPKKLNNLSEPGDSDALQWFETVWEHVECGITIIDAETREIMAVNPVAARMFGDDINKIIGKQCHKFICPAEQKSCPIMDKGQVVDRSERKFVKSDGSTIPIIKSVAKFSYKNRLALLESFTDISTLKEAEQKLRSLEVAEQASKAKSDFLSRMSHEMRTPMNAIIGMAKIAEKTDDIQRLKHCLAMINTSSQHLLSLINDVLDMSKIEANKLELEKAPFTIEHMLKKICNLVVENVEKKEIDLSVCLDPGMPSQYIGDELRLSQILANLISNAVKFTNKGGSIRLETRLLERNNKTSRLQFTVADSGIGMTEEQVAKLFTAFEQTDSSITRRFGGTGLGLAISKSIAEEMNGSIRVESVPQKGSSFIVEVEMENDPTENTAEPFVNLPARARLLFADSNLRATEQFLAMTQHWGLSVDTAENAGQLSTMLETARKENRPYTMLFLATDLPGGNGLDLAREKLQNREVDNVALLVPLLQWHLIASEAQSIGITNFITKPLFSSAIIDAISNAANDVPQMEIPLDVLPEKTDLSGISLLLAEDVAINREIFAALLEPSGLNITMAENGIAAVEKFQASPDAYDIIIMDVQMPEMDGYEATRTIRRLATPKAVTIPIIAMTANAFREDVEKCLASGMDDHLPKPIEENLVIEKILQYSGKTRA